ncbi:hypothetical protein LAZ67_23001455 [Cordylochernes scorpioides]|uniref:Uncharacterized protein n=1 Tax=Cordylochernes scorpioides TaxID=51811 RepID=A0ABY6LR37_9ARAC|nr:hypothetical protein LAZ67_23001455 [Cordylochernes scorpioides]
MDQKSGETISKYMIRLKDQAQKCSFGDFLQESLRDRFVAGIIDSSTQKKLLQEENLTFDGAVDIALSAESADNELHNIKGSENAHQSPQVIEILITDLNFSKFILGRDFLSVFDISFNSLHKLDSFNVESLINDYKSIFEYKSGPIKGIKCHLDVKADFIPKFYKFRQVPFALKQLVEDEIDKLVDLNILSDCASPFVCVAKPDGQIRLCADFKNSLNPYLEDVKYPIPNIDSVLNVYEKPTIETEEGKRSNKRPVEKNFVKAMNPNVAGFAYLKQKFPSISDTKIKEAISVGLQIRELLQDGNFEDSLNEI